MPGACAEAAVCCDNVPEHQELCQALLLKVDHPPLTEGLPFTVLHATCQALY